MKSKFLLSTFAAALLIGGGCSETDEMKPIRVTEVSLNETMLAMVAGETSQLTVTIVPSDAEYDAVIWSSDKPEIATVSEDGLVTAITAGEATITAKAGEKSATCGVTIRNPVATVYATGYYDRISYAYYWHSGMDQPTMLGDKSRSTRTNSIFVAGNDVYVGGETTTDEQGYFAPTLWKNGIATYLTDPTAPIDGTVNSVYVKNNDVYASGFYRVNETPTTSFRKDVATIWKNGTPIELTTGSNYAQVRAVFASDNAVYAVGESSNTDGFAIATLWSNNTDDWSNKTVKNLSDGTNHAYAQSVCVSGNDVYAVGYGYKNKPQYIAMLWKNDEPVQLLSENASWAYSVCVANGHVYVAGWEYKTYDGKECSVATLWKDGVAAALSTEQKSSQARCVFVSGDDVYVSGFLGDVAVVWENGTPTVLSDGKNTAAITSVFVTKK